MRFSKLVSRFRDLWRAVFFGTPLPEHRADIDVLREDLADVMKRLDLVVGYVVAAPKDTKRILDILHAFTPIADDARSSAERAQIRIKEIERLNTENRQLHAKVSQLETSLIEAANKKQAECPDTVLPEPTNNALPEGAVIAKAFPLQDAENGYPTIDKNLLYAPAQGVIDTLLAQGYLVREKAKETTNG